MSAPLTLDDLRALDADVGVSSDRLVATLAEIMTRLQALETGNVSEVFTRVLKLLEDTDPLDRPRILNAVAAFYGIDEVEVTVEGAVEIPRAEDAAS